MGQLGLYAACLVAHSGQRFVIPLEGAVPSDEENAAVDECLPTAVVLPPLSHAASPAVAEGLGLASHAGTDVRHTAAVRLTCWRPA